MSMPALKWIPNLKTKLRLRTCPYTLFSAGTIAWFSLGTPLTIDPVKQLSLSDWVLPALLTVLSVVVSAVDTLPGPNGKATLVFWRLRNPLPSSRGFNRANLDADPRIDRQRLLQAVGKKFPRSASDQTTTWYRLYNGVKADKVVQALHFDYLLFRDLAWLSIFLFTLSLVSLALTQSPPLRIVTLLFAFLYLIFRQAAAERGRRFVNQVLVAACFARAGVPV